MRLEHLPEPPLEFGETASYEIIDPVYGLNRFGPFDFPRGRKFESISFIAIGPKSRQTDFEALGKNLTNGVKQLKFEPDFKGLVATYRLQEDPLSAKPNERYVAVDDFRGTTEEKYSTAIKYVQENKKFNILFIIEPDDIVYYLHDMLRRDCISRGIFSQYLEKETLGQKNQGSVLHNIAVATYAKAGGMPWRVKHPTITNSCTLGLSFHILKKIDPSQTNRTIVGIAELLDEYGRHLTIKTSHANVTQEIVSKFRREFRSLYVPRDLMEALVKDALDVTQWPGRTVPVRLVVHKTTPFHEEEIAGLQAALEKLELNIEYALVHIREDTVQRVYREKDKEAVRGMLLTLRDDIPEVILWPVGKVPSKYWDKNKREYEFFEKSGTKIGTSDPISIYLNPASRCSSFTVVDAAKQVHALSKMRWNTVEMSIRIPVSIYLARQVGTFVTAAMRHNADMSFVNQLDARYFW